MSQFRYSLTLDGQVQPVVGSNSASAAAAIAYGRAMLIAAVKARDRRWAWCVVHAADKAAAVPLGVWDWSAELAWPIWTKAEA